MDVKCAQLLPSVCTVLADPKHPTSDDTCLEKLLDWFKTLTGPGSSLRLLEGNPCLTELIHAVLRQEEPNPTILSFVLRLTGILAASESSFQHLQQGEAVFGAFGEAGPLSSALWEDMSIRSGWVQGAYSMLQHYSAFQFLCNSGSLDVIFTLQGDRSLFVAAGANRLLARVLIFSVQSEPSRLLGLKDGDWPACARMIVARVEDSLTSHSATRVKYSLQLLMTLFEHNQEAWTETLWSQVVEAVESLLAEELVQAGHLLVDLFLTMARSPAFHCPECSLWKLVRLALKNFSLTQSGPLALGLLKLEACPQVIQRQALSILLQPMSCVLRLASPSLEFPDLPAVPATEAASVESLLSSRSSCISLLCQTLAHLEELQGLACLAVEFPHQPLLHAVGTVLQFCAGLAVPFSPLGDSVGKILIGSFRVQRVALGLLGALSRWAASVSEETMAQILDILLVYLKSPETSSTVLKKAFQATLKWLLSTLEPSGSTDDFQRHKQFVRDMLPVLQKRLCSPSWEVRDSALEFLTQAMKRLRGQEWFWQELLSSEVLPLAEGLLGDAESYVRASAVEALGLFSLLAGANLEEPSSEKNGSNKEGSVGARLLEILSTDSEGFPRRAVMGIFTAWLQKGHPEVLADPEPFVSRALQAANRDLDWEVKVSGLELAEVFAAQVFGRFGLAQCPSAADPPPSSQPPCRLEVLQAFCRVKLFEFLFGALCDCDRPVALKACEILLAVKSKICKDRSLEEEKRSLELNSPSPAKEETAREVSLSSLLLLVGDSAKVVSQDPKGLILFLETIDLEGLQRSLDRSSDHLEKSPRSLLQDILSAAGNMEENEADCY